MGRRPSPPQISFPRVAPTAPSLVRTSSVARFAVNGTFRGPPCPCFVRYHEQPLLADSCILDARRKTGTWLSRWPRSTRSSSPASAFTHGKIRWLPLALLCDLYSVAIKTLNLVGGYRRGRRIGWIRSGGSSRRPQRRL